VDVVTQLRSAALCGSPDDLVVYADWLEERQLTWTLLPDPEAFELDTGGRKVPGRYGDGYGVQISIGPLMSDEKTASEKEKTR